MNKHKGYTFMTRDTSLVDTKNTQAGFGLIQTAVMISVAAILIVPFLNMANIEKVRDEREALITKVDSIDEKIRRYAMDNGHYPVPASPSLRAGEANYGLQDPSFPQPDTNFPGEFFYSCTHSGVNGSPFASADGVQCVNGVDYAGAIINVQHAQNAQNILIGIVPFRELGLSAADVTDEYGNFLTYAVTAHLAHEDGFRRSAREGEGSSVPYVDFDGDGFNDGPHMGGTIYLEYYNPELFDPADPAAAVTATRDNVHYLVFSHGRNGAGAYNVNTTQIEVVCDPQSRTSTYELDNCDRSDGFFTALYSGTTVNNEPFASRGWALGSQDVYYDDVIAVAGINDLSEGFWTRFEDTDPNQNQRDIAYLNEDDAVISVDYDAPTFAKVHVNGNMGVSDIDGDGAGDVLSRFLCSADQIICADGTDMASNPGCEIRIGEINGVTYTEPDCVDVNMFENTGEPGSDSSDLSPATTDNVNTYEGEGVEAPIKCARSRGLKSIAKLMTGTDVVEGNVPANRRAAWRDCDGTTNASGARGRTSSGGLSSTGLFLQPAPGAQMMHNFVFYSGCFNTNPNSPVYQHTPIFRAIDPVTWELTCQ